MIHDPFMQVPRAFLGPGNIHLQGTTADIPAKKGEELMINHSIYRGFQ